MPFIKKEDNTYIFQPPTSEDITNTRLSIIEVEESTVVDKDLNQRLRDKLDEATQYIIQGGKNFVPFINRNLYDCLDNLVTTPLGLVDIILPVYNSIHIAKQCIEKVLTRTTWPYKLYIVDDASDTYTKTILKKIADENPNKITLITNRKNKGFAASVNAGIKAGSGEYVCLLNSDVLVTKQWLTKMVLAIQADSRNQIVCPATNNTAVVDIPMAQGASYLRMNSIFERFAVRRYPELMPTGFCFLFRRDLLKKIGYFDEGYTNFGEETASWYKTISYTTNGYYPRYKAVMADDCYVLHERGSSYASLGAETHLGWRKLASSRFNEQFPNWKLWQKNYNVNKTIGYLRQPIIPQLVNDFKTPYRVCWVVHDVQRCGGMAYIADIVNELIERGIDAKVCLIKRQPTQTTDYIGELRCAPIIFEDHTDFLSTFQSKVFRRGIVIAATVELSSVVRTLAESYQDIIPVLHCQSYEPEIVGDDIGLIEKIKQHFNYIPNVITNSNWITEKFEKEYNITPFATVHPGVDIDLFYPRNRLDGDERPTVMIPVHKQAYRGYARSLKLIYLLETEAEKRGMNLRILLYGVNKNPVSPNNAIALGSLPPIRLAVLLGTEVDVFIEPSLNHSYGLPALEAMVSGVPVVSWDNKGINEYAKDVENASIFESSTSPEKVVKRTLDLLQDQNSREYFSKKGLELRETHSRKQLVSTFIEQLEKKFNLRIASRRIEVIVPHMRKHGGPTTMIALANQLALHGHTVGITTLHSDINHEVAQMTDVPITNYQDMVPKCDVAIINSDNPLCPAVSSASRIKRKIMLKLSHNPRFKVLEEQGLNLPWDAIVTSSDWLKEVTENTTPNWNYKPRQANKIGWWHYSFDKFQKEPSTRTYGNGIETPIIISTLLHTHPLKGSKEAVGILGKIHDIYGSRVRFIAIGEVDPKTFQTNLANLSYKFAPTRDELAGIFQTTDIWLGASQTEGLGRLGLEAMSAGVVPVLSDTNPEYAQDGVNSLLYPIGNIDKAVEAIVKLIENAELRRSMQEQAFRTAKRYSDPSNCISSLEKIIRDLF